MSFLLSNFRGEAAIHKLPSKEERTAKMMPSLAADEWKEMESGIPSTQEPFIRKYVEGREKLIREEKKQRGGMPPSSSIPLNTS